MDYQSVVLRFKRVLNGGSFFYEERSGYTSIDGAFLAAHVMATVELDIDHVDVYKGDRRVATFYRVIE
ncbi:MAG: hypothetical protein IJ190_14385 [Prevotella sp.]|nr:hypothetical protein [Prevotella sp.]